MLSTNFYSIFNDFYSIHLKTVKLFFFLELEDQTKKCPWLHCTLFGESSQCYWSKMCCGLAFGIFVGIGLWKSINWSLTQVGKVFTLWDWKIEIQYIIYFNFYYILSSGWFRVCGSFSGRLYAYLYYWGCTVTHTDILSFSLFLSTRI